MPLAPLSAGFQSLPPLSTINCTTIVVLIAGGWVCVHSRPLWVPPTNSPVRLGVSPTAASTPTGFNQWFEALFPSAGFLGCTVYHWVCQLQLCLPHSSICRLAGYASHHLAHPGPPATALSSPPGCLCLPHLLV